MNADEHSRANEQIKAGRARLMDRLDQIGQDLGLDADTLADLRTQEEDLWRERARESDGHPLSDEERDAIRKRARAQLDEIHRKMKDVSEEEILELLRLDEEDRKRARREASAAQTHGA